MLWFLKGSKGEYWSDNTARLVGTFELGAKVSSHATSPIAFHLLVACGTQRLGARLVDLPSSAAVQSLVSHGQINGSAAANLAVTWSLVHDHIVASGPADGVAHLWNIRRHSTLIGLLDQEDRLGVIYSSRMDSSGHVQRALFQNSLRFGYLCLSECAQGASKRFDLDR